MVPHMFASSLLSRRYGASPPLYNVWGHPLPDCPGGAYLKRSEVYCQGLFQRLNVSFYWYILATGVSGYQAWQGKWRGSGGRSLAVLLSQSRLAGLWPMWCWQPDYLHALR